MTEIYSIAYNCLDALFVGLESDTDWSYPNHAVSSPAPSLSSEFGGGDTETLVRGCTYVWRLTRLQFITFPEDSDDQEEEERVSWHPQITRNGTFLPLASLIYEGLNLHGEGLHLRVKDCWVGRWS